jgi:hypothetical protein
MTTPRKRRRDGQPLPRDLMLIIAAVNSHADAVQRLRRAAFGLDRQDRIAEAERISLQFDASRGRRRVQQRSRNAASSI